MDKTETDLMSTGYEILLHYQQVEEGERNVNTEKVVELIKNGAYIHHEIFVIQERCEIY